MKASVIRATLGLLIRLIDTTTGAAVEENNVHFFVNGQTARPAPRGDGCFVFINIERTDFRLDVEVTGYERRGADVHFEELDDRIPTCDIFLIPSEKYAKGETVIGIFGNLPFLEAIEAVDLDRPVCRISDFTEKKRKMTVIKQSGRILDMDYGHYGLLQADAQSYEKLYVSETDADQNLILKDVLELPFTVNMPIFRIVFGDVDKAGNYLLRIRDDGKKQRYLLRYVVKKKVYFQEVDFHDPETQALTKHLEKKRAAGSRKKAKQEDKTEE